ncbi:MAG: glycoside hydrolase family 88 protein [Verrucomicrobiales bacterium]|nr:glycoside hydrolase family 88 protein [Verrucomicrobiales bacterium]MCP5525647.1 glycoside hydrolase family 88 protein [Verrucomicrobiales bacterium]
MPIKTDARLTPKKLVPKIERLFDLSGRKILSIEKTWKPAQGTPVFTVKGRYSARGWTEWTQGFQYGSAVLQFDATGDERFLEIGRRGTVERMAGHVSHIGVHDHGFNNVSTYGNLLRLMREGRLPADPREQEFHELALKISGAVQAARWTRLADGTGFIHSFNGPHSLFVDTIRSCRALAVAHRLGHVLMGEQDAKISLLHRLLDHASNTARYSVYYGEGRDAYDLRGRTTHEAVFNTVSGVFRCPNSQQGYSPFSTWTRGLAWAICGFAEQLEFLRDAVTPEAPEFQAAGRSLAEVERLFRKAAMATADFHLENCCADGVPMWDTGAPNLHRLPAGYLQRRSDPGNAWEPVDSSAAAIAAQGLIRLGNYLGAGKRTGANTGLRDTKAAARYRLAGLKIAETLFSEPYLSVDSRHQGLLLHSVYHRPNGWDYIAPGQRVPNGESSMWGDYHARELALLILREARGEPYLTFYGCCGGSGADGV